MPVRFLISTLKPGVSPEEYERWVREVDYPFVGTKSNYIAYEVHRIRRPVSGADQASWQYIERMEVASTDQHDRDLDSPEGRAMREQLYGRFLDREKNIYFTTDRIDRDA
jgi:hypothetical protein